MTFAYLLIRVHLLFSLIIVNESHYPDGFSVGISGNEVAPYRQPLLIVEEKKSFSLARPILVDDVLQVLLRGKQHLVLACPVEQRTTENEDTNNNSASLVVDKQSNFDWQWSNVECNGEVEAQVKVTEERCADKTGAIYEIGFYIEKGYESLPSKLKHLVKRDKKKESEWYKVIEVCYDEQHSNPIYSSHTLLASSFEVKFRLTVRPNLVDYVRNYRPFSQILESYYLKGNQYENFVNIFGEKVAPIYYDRKSKYIKEAQLTPADDFLYPVLQSAAFSYLNVFPGWAALVDRSWKKVENAVREFSYNIEEDLIITTGISGLLQLKNEFGEMKEIYLDSQNQRMKVPDVVWKTVFQPSTKQAIVFFMYHNPYRDNCYLNICYDICADYGWHKAKSHNLDRGCIFCCDFREVQGKLDNLPSIEVDGMLHF